MRKYIILLTVIMTFMFLFGCNTTSKEPAKVTQTNVTEMQQSTENNAQGEQTKNDDTAIEVKEEQPTETTQEETTASRLEGLKQAFKDAGFDVGENEALAFEMLYASNGMKFKVDGELIEIYEYDLSNLSDEAKNIIEQAKNGTIDMSGFKIRVVYKDGLMMARHDEHSKGDKILEVFNNYK